MGNQKMTLANEDASAAKKWKVLTLKGKVNRTAARAAEETAVGDGQDPSPGRRCAARTWTRQPEAEACWSDGVRATPGVSRQTLKGQETLPGISQH